MSAVAVVADPNETKAFVVLISKALRRRLTLRWKVDNDVVAVVNPLAKKYSPPMIAYAMAPHDKVRFWSPMKHCAPCIWIGSAAFDLDEGEVAKIADALGLAEPPPVEALAK